MAKPEIQLDSEDEDSLPRESIDEQARAPPDLDVDGLDFQFAIDSLSVGNTEPLKHYCELLIWL
jgi:hypothetical protein